MRERRKRESYDRDEDDFAVTSAVRSKNGVGTSSRAVPKGEPTGGGEGTRPGRKCFEGVEKSA